MKNMSTSLEDSVVQRIERLAKERSISDASIIRQCVLAHLDQLERELRKNGHGHKRKH